MPQVWIDSDLGFDDLAAILMVQYTPGWSIAGMSLVAGNAPLEVATDNALRAAHCFGWHFPIHVGCHQPLTGPLVTAQDVLGADAMKSAGRSLPLERTTAAPQGAVPALAAWLMSCPGKARVLALGPLTNIATLLREHPGAADRIGQLVWMGGSQGPGNHTAAAEFNAAVDPEAVQEVLDAGLPFTMVGLDACRQVKVVAADCDVLRRAPGHHSDLLADLLLGYVRIATPDGGGAERPMALYDPVAAACLVLPQAVDTAAAHIVVERQGQHTRGMTVVERRVPRKATANARVADTVQTDLVRELFFAALTEAARSP
ncbi:MAG: hypothetical protein RLZZ126_22 [Pseudomonadota bacterium]|jgi:purine nucleosidase